MHPEVENSIRQHARGYLATAAAVEKNPCFCAAERGYITFDDLYFLGIVDGSGSVALTDLVETGNAPVVEHPEYDASFVMQDDSEFRSTENERQFHLVSQLYDCTPEQAEERWETIQSDVTRYINDQTANKDK